MVRLTRRAKVGSLCAVSAIISIALTQFGNEIRSSQQGLEIIGQAEGCKRDPYHCPANVLTVGIGSTEASGNPIDPHKRYSDMEIAARWVNDVSIAESCVTRWANGDKLPQSVFEAATSFAFNVGCGKASYSKLFGFLRSGQYQKACNEFPKWIYAGGKALPGLVERRAKERMLCLQDLSSTYSP